MATAQDLLAVAAGEVGYSRWDDPQPGTKYGRWYEANVDRCATNYDYGASGVPYCAMYSSWCLWTTGVPCAGFPSAYCPSIHNHETLEARDLQPGDIVLFDWEPDGTDDHVGIVEWNDGRQVGTIEGNTNNGAVARRTRPYSSICGGIRPDYDAALPDAPTESVTWSRLDEDGWFGPATVLRSQQHFGTTQDGYISGQAHLAEVDDGGLGANAWMTGTGGSQVVSSMQGMLGIARTGQFDRATVIALQTFLGTTQDGVVSGPSQMARAWQRWLNERR